MSTIIILVWTRATRRSDSEIGGNSLVPCISRTCESVVIYTDRGTEVVVQSPAGTIGKIVIINNKARIVSAVEPDTKTRGTAHVASCNGIGVTVSVKAYSCTHTRTIVVVEKTVGRGSYK